MIQKFAKQLDLVFLITHLVVLEFQPFDLEPEDRLARTDTCITLFFNLGPFDDTDLTLNGKGKWRLQIATMIVSKCDEDDRRATVQYAGKAKRFVVNLKRLPEKIPAISGLESRLFYDPNLFTDRITRNSLKALTKTGEGI